MSTLNPAYPSGGGLTPEQEETITSLQSLDVGQIPSATGTGDFDYSGATKSPIDEEVTFDKATNFTQASINISEAVTISEATFTPFFRDNVLDTGAVNAVAVIDETGTDALILLAATNEKIIVAQGDDGTEFNANPFSAQLLATNANQTNAVTIRTAAAMPNTRMTITDDVSGLVVKYIPNEAAVRTGTGGLDLRAGDNRVDFDSDLPDDPSNGLFYIGHTPLRQYAGEFSTFEIEADSVSILGNPSGTPYFQNEIQFLQPKIVPYTEDITHVLDNFTRLNTGYGGPTHKTGGVAITSKSIGLGDSVTSGQFTQGFDGINNPSIITDGSGTFSQGDIVQVYKSKFNNHYVEVESHIGNVLFIRGVGTVDTVEAFTDRDLTTAVDSALLEKVKVTVLQTRDDGKVERGCGDETPVVFSVLSEVGDSVTIHSDVSSAGSGEIITTAERNKLNSLTGGRYLGVFADLAALQTAHPAGVQGDTATVTSPNGNMFYWNTGTVAWEDSGTGYVGDMLSSVYDPSAIGSDAFSMGNMIETVTKKVLLDTERTKLTGIEALAEVNNISDSDATELTSGGDTELHSHPFNFGAGYFSAQVDTTITVAGTYYKVPAVFTPTTETNVEWDVANARWNYTGNGTGSSLEIILSFTAGQNENGKKDISYRLVISGGAVTNPYPDKDLAVDKNLPTSVTFLIPDVHLTNGDYIELYATHESNGKKVETSNCSILIR